MGDIFLKLLNMSITAGWLILAVLCFRLLFRKSPKWVNCLLWGVVAIKLICPITIESPFSVLPSKEPIKTSTITEGEVQNHIPSIDSNLTIVVVENTMQVFTFIAGIIWCSGMIALMLYTLVSALRLRYLVREAVCYRDNIFICDAVKTPFILGIIRPRIYLSSSVKEQDLDYIIAHELAHLKRKDHWWKPFGYLLLCVYWFQPLCWVAYILFCKDIELACDEKVIKDMTFDEKKQYSRVLLSCAQQRRLVMACPLAFGEVGVKERVKSVLNYKQPAFWIVVAAIVVCLIIAVCFLTTPLEENQIDNDKNSKYYAHLEEIVESKIKEGYEISDCEVDIICLNDEVVSVDVRVDLKDDEIEAFETDMRKPISIYLGIPTENVEISRIDNGDTMSQIPADEVTTEAGIRRWTVWLPLRFLVDIYR